MNREQWFAVNITNRSVSLGVNAGALRPAARIDLLTSWTKEKVRQSRDIKTFIQKGYIEIQQIQDDVLIQTINHENVETALATDGIVVIPDVAQPATLDTVQSELKDSNGDVVLDWSSPTAAVFEKDISTSCIVTSGLVESVNIDDHKLIDDDGLITLDWQTRQLKDNDGQVVFDWASGIKESIDSVEGIPNSGDEETNQLLTDLKNAVNAIITTLKSYKQTS